MTLEQKNEIRNSWNMIRPQVNQAGMIFYEKLFALAPEIRGLFKEDMTEQANKLMQVLEYVVQHLDDLETMVQEIEALGMRHKHYGAEPSHYETVGTCLLDTLAGLLGAYWTPEVKNAWTTAYYQVKHSMIVAQSRAHPDHTS